MSAYVIRRVLTMPLILLLILAINFAVMRVVPGGPYQTEGRPMAPEIKANFQARYHLDEPAWKQFVRYIAGDRIFGDGDSWGMLGLDFGPSYQYKGRSVQDILFEGGLTSSKVSVSIQVGILAVFIALLFGIPLGLISALKQNSLADYVSMFFAMIGVSIPNFVLGLFLIVLILWLDQRNWNFLHIPLARWGDLSLSWNGYFRYMLLPALTLGTGGTALIARLTRASMLEVIRQDYIRTARAKGLRQRSIIVGHALKNSLIPVTTVLGPLMAAWLTGSFLVEQVFSIPGMGKHFVTSIPNRDYNVIGATIAIYAVMLIVLNLLVDVSYVFLDPRIRLD
jgi:ABC-type dipeptide/oligopeptide/nickel transport system permease component